MRLRKGSLTESQESEAKYRGLLEAAPDAMIVVKEDGEIVLLNARVEKQFGYRRDQLVGRNVTILIPEGFKERLFSDALRSRADALAQQIGSGLELSGRRSDGTEFPIEIMLSPLESAGETLVTAAIRDITERRRIEEALRQSEARARELLENATGAIYISSVDGTVVQVNRAAERLEGRPRLEIVGRSVLDSIAPEERENTGRSFGDILSEGSVLGFETRSLRADGTSVPTEVLASLVEVGGERFIHATVHDVSQRKSLEEQLRHAQKMEAVGRLAAGIAHDFNNLLTVILGSSEILELHLADPDAIRRDLRELRHAAERGAALTGQLLAFSRKQVLKPVALDPGEVLAGMSAMLGGLLGERIDLSFSVAPDTGRVLLDRGQLEQVIMNLAVNARDAMPAGGKLSIRVEPVERDENYTDLHLRARPGPFVRITVEDDGIGMTAEVKSHVFEPFFTTKESGKGTGLGLATVYGIAHSAGGDVWVYSEPGHGTTFKIFLPRMEGTDERTRTTPTPTPVPVRTGTDTIFLLEDDNTIRAMAEEYLSAKGYRVVSARDGDEMLRLAASHAESFDVLVTDVVVPGKNGREVAEALREKNPALPVIFMSGYTDDAVIVRGAREGGMEFLQKPFDLSTLARKIAEILDRRLPG